MPESKLEQILKGEKPETQAKGNEPTLQTALDREMEGEDSELAKELQRSRAEAIIARRRAMIERMKMVGSTGENLWNGAGGGARERGKEWLTEVAQGLLERGVDPTTVSRLIDNLLGNTAAVPMVGMPGMGLGTPAPQQGLTFADVTALFNMFKENSKPSAAIESILEKLANKLEALESRVARPPEAPPKRGYIVVKPDGSVQEVEPDKPIVVQPPAPTIEGERLEVAQARYHHEEEMAKIRVEETHKNQLAEIVGSIPEAIGRGMAHDARENMPSGSAEQTGQSGKLITEPCPDEKCKAIMRFPPDALNVTCAKCGEVWKREPKK